jgi:hypothetical protein
MFHSNPPTTLAEAHQRYHKFALAIMSAIAIFFIVVCVTLLQQGRQSGKIEDTASDAKQVAIDQKEGRRIAIDFTCAGLKAVIQAGRNIVIGEKKVSPLEAAILKDYNIPQKVLQDSRQKSAKKYSRDIVETLDKETNFPIKEVLNKNGTINCKKLESLSKAG